jgi:hypothetical protein
LPRERLAHVALCTYAKVASSAHIGRLLVEYQLPIDGDWSVVTPRLYVVVDVRMTASETKRRKRQVGELCNGPNVPLLVVSSGVGTTSNGDDFDGINLISDQFNDAIQFDGREYGTAAVPGDLDQPQGDRRLVPRAPAQ